MSLNNHFTHIFCVNLARRVDRRQQAEAEFAKHGIKNVEFFAGVDGLTLNIPQIQSADGQLVSRGDIGCTRSHYNVAKMCKEKGITRYLVLEDDVQFASNLNDVFDGYMAQLPDNFDFFYLGGNHCVQPQPVTQNIARIFQTYTTHAYAVQHMHTIDAILDVLGKDNEKVDIGISSLHKFYNSYVCRPHLAGQRDSFSDILERDCSYGFLWK